jgi:prevent-host-death family protein
MRDVIMNMQEAKTNLSKLVNLAQSGRGVYIANRGSKVAKLVPIDDDRRKRKSGFVHLNIDLEECGFFEPLSDEEMGLSDDLSGIFE